MKAKTPNSTTSTVKVTLGHMMATRPIMMAKMPPMTSAPQAGEPTWARGRPL